MSRKQLEYSACHPISPASFRLCSCTLPWEPGGFFRLCQHTPVFHVMLKFCPSYESRNLSCMNLVFYLHRRRSRTTCGSSYPSWAPTWKARRFLNQPRYGAMSCCCAFSLRCVGMIEPCCCHWRHDLQCNISSSALFFMVFYFSNLLLWHCVGVIRSKGNVAATSGLSVDSSFPAARRSAPDS